MECCDAIEWLNRQPADSADLVFGSPPYEMARLYLEGGKNLGVARKTEEWIAWMVEVYRAAQRVCKGLVAFVVAGQTKNYRWSAGPALLAADLHRAGFNLRNPPIFSRVGIPGSGGPDWLRGDYEWIICTSRPGKLPWSDNTVMGHPPKWAPGGEMSHRISNGARVNQWGHPIDSGATVVAADGVVTSKGKRPSHRIADPWGKRGRGNNIGGRKKTGEVNKGTTAAQDLKTRKEEANGNLPKRRVTSGHKDGDTPNGDSYDPPVLANHGNIIHLNVGGGVMGHPLCHDNEAPFPELLPEFFIRSFCPPGGVVCDPFSGSGTTASVALANHRNFRGCDLRQSQVDLTLRRISETTPLLPGIE